MEFLRWKRGMLGWLAVYGGVFGIVFLLYDLPIGPVIYGFLLILGISSGFLFFSYIRYRKKRGELEGLKRQAERGGVLLENIQSEYCFEREYLAILKNMERRERKLCESRREEERRDREYYTRWSHQIKTPIAAVKLLLSEKEPDWRSIKREVFRVEQYVDMALQYQRMEGEAKDLVLQNASIQKMVRQTLKKLSSIFVYKKLHVEFGNLEKEYVTDEKWMCFILEQLLMNAAKYTGEGGRIRIGLEGNTLSIRDNGIGIQEEDLPRIFEWGYTGYNGRLDKRSTGIGLALVKKAAEMLRLKISISSKAGIGTEVEIDLAQTEINRE